MKKEIELKSIHGSEKINSEDYPAIKDMLVDKNVGRAKPLKVDFSKEMAQATNIRL